MTLQVETALADAVLASAASSNPRGDLLPQLIAAARRHLGMEVGFVSEFIDGKRVFRYVDSDLPGALAVGDADPLEDSYCQRVMDGRLPELITDAQQLPEARALAATEAFPVGAHLSVPLTLSDGRIYGTFCCLSRQADGSLNERDVKLLRVFADVARTSIEAELRDSARRSRVEDQVRTVLVDEAMLTMVFQPIVSLRDRTIRGFEALARFNDPDGRGPAEWFSDAAMVGLGVELEISAMSRALAALPRLASDAYLAVNLSPEALLTNDVADMIR